MTSKTPCASDAPRQRTRRHGDRAEEEEAVKYAVEAHLRRVYYRWFQTDILPALVARGLTVGRNFYMLDRESIDWEHCWHVTIGDDVTFAKGVRLIAHDAS